MAMIKVSVLYPNKGGAKFDMGYYFGKHLPMVKQKLGAACKSMTAEQGIAGGAPGSAPAFVAMVHFTFESTDAFEKAFGPHAKEIMADIPNYTTIEPVIQIGDVKM
jgi:uncharacterized protein (TIGR02118 family)